MPRWRKVQVAGCRLEVRGQESEVRGQGVGERPSHELQPSPFDAKTPRRKDAKMTGVEQTKGETETTWRMDGIEY